MKFSIITPCYNSAKTIEQTIESVFYQRGDFNIQYIVIDGKSSDSTIEIINDYYNNLRNNNIPLKCNGIEMHVISESDNGMYDAISKGISIANGDITSYINSDDYYLPNAFITLEYIFKGFPSVKWLTCMNVWYNSLGSIYFTRRPFRYKPNLIRKGYYNGKFLPHIQQESTFWRSELNELLDLNLMKGFKLAGDYYLWYTFAKYYNLYVLNNQISGFRVTPNQKSNNIQSYNSEFFNIHKLEKITFVDVIRAYIEKMLWYGPEKFKRRFRKKTNIIFDNQLIESFQKDF